MQIVNPNYVYLAIKDKKDRLVEEILAEHKDSYSDDEFASLFFGAQNASELIQRFIKEGFNQTEYNTLAEYLDRTGLCNENYFWGELYEFSEDGNEIISENWGCFYKKNLLEALQEELDRV